ncbi:hypothetical protein G5714_008477 [Onychostoma macrolepis]|uniref:Uncharacterized protein n=1 Tax=Onychostoma macrolepis TaxID=369639 RepID=A0A7J6CVU4_9TELE|nr:hypothetical protein G5714_008477 [Onychostoma macrolepis]
MLGTVVVILEALVYSSRRTQASAWRVNIYAITSSVTRAAGLHWPSLYKAGSTLMLCPFSSGNHTGRDPVLVCTCSYDTGPPEQGFCIG